MATPLISVALCTYNGEKFIAAQLESILAQTHQNLEIIITDDRSTDDTWLIVNGFAKKDARIKCHRNDVNLGYNKNFEKAIGLTTGDYIAISDQDDIWKPEKLETLLKNIGDNWLIFSNSTYINQAGEHDNTEILPDFSLPAQSFKSLLLQNWVTGHTVLMKREFLDHCLPFPTGGFYDWWMGFVAVYHHKITFINEVLTFYRRHSTSVTQQIEMLGGKKSDFDVNLAMLGALAKYNGLTTIDRDLIKAFLQAMAIKRHRFSSPLMAMVYKYYDELFPGSKKRTGLSRINFALKFARRIR